MPAPFVTGYWSNLVLLTYEAPESLLRPSLHPALELDRWEGKTHVNLVALHFGRIRVLGRRIPGLGGFAQLNLRTFVRHEGRPGVVFLRQYVPSLLVVALSRLRYRQPYRTLPITHLVATGDGGVTAEYLLDQPPRGCVIATGSEGAAVPPTDSFAHYCKERFWGFGRARGGRLREFRVEHQPWAIREVRGWQLLLDFGAFFGPDWRFLNDRKPDGVVFAVGSDVAVYAPTDSTNSSPSP